MPAETKHTPGPWVAAREYGEWDVRTKDGDIIAAIHDVESSDDEEPNARLIAAAPDLYAALLSAREQLEQYELDRTGEAYNDPQINDALAKVEG